MEQTGNYADALRGNHGGDLRSLLERERDRTMRFRDQLAEERKKSAALESKIDQLERWVANLGGFARSAGNDWRELALATGLPHSNHQEALEWIKRAKTASHNAKYYADMSLRLEKEIEGLRKVNYHLVEKDRALDGERQKIEDTKWELKDMKNSRDYWMEIAAHDGNRVATLKKVIGEARETLGRLPRS